MSDKELKADLVEAARAEEVATVRKMNVWVKVDREQFNVYERRECHPSSSDGWT